MAVRITTDKTARIPTADLYPDYHDPRFQGGRRHTVFLTPGRQLVATYLGIEEIEGASYLHDDRITGDAIDRARAEIDSDHTAVFFERALQYTLENAGVELQHIVTRVDPTTGYSDRIYGFTAPDQQA